MTTMERTHESTPADLWPTLGPQVCRWIEATLVHGEGDSYGKPWKLRRDQKLFLYRWYEYEEGTGKFATDGTILELPTWRYDAAFLEEPKGAGKTEFVGAIGLAEFAGPVAPPTPNVPVAAASFEQADLLFGRVRQMATHDNSLLAPFIDAFDTEILLKGQPGRMYRVAAKAGTNDGSLPTLFLADEVHEWTGGKERVHLVISNSLRKRRGGRVINLSTPGFELESLAGKLHDKGIKGTDDRFLHLWYTAPEDVDLKDVDQRRAAIKLANPWMDSGLVEGLVRRYDEIPDHEFRRYHLAQWVRVPEDGWLADRPGAWEVCEGKTEFTDNGDVVLAIDMSLRHDTTAVVMVQRHGDKVHVKARVWEAKGERIDYLEVRNYVRQMTHQYRAKGVGYDPRFLEALSQELRDEGINMIEIPQSPERMEPACARAYELILSERVVHDGDPVLAAHVNAAQRRESGRGWRLTKGKSKSPIDACVAMVMAIAEAFAEEESSVYEERDMVIL